MNNGFLELEELDSSDNSATIIALREKQTALVEILKSLNEIVKMPEFSVLKEMVFDKMVQEIEKRIKSESLKNELNGPEIYRLQGQLAWAKRYSNFYKLAETYKQELENLTRKLTEVSPQKPNENANAI